MEEAVDKGRATGVPLGQSLIDAGIVDSNQLAQALAERNGLDYVDLNAFEVDQGAANLIDAGKARRYQTIPISFLGEQTLLVATADPANVLALDDIAMATGYEVRRAVASPEDIDALIGQLSRLGDAVEELEDEPESAAEVIELRDQADEAPVVKLVHSVIADAVRRGASDIHFEPRASDMRVRYRVDGVVIDTTTVPRQLVAGLISRVKIMANLDIAERRVPQDGRIGLSVDGRHVDLRVATLPVVRGESVVMRILDKEAVVMDLDVLGMAEHDRKRFDDALARHARRHPRHRPDRLGQDDDAVRRPDRRQHARRRRSSPSRTRSSTSSTGVKQVQVNPKTGLTFAAGLRSMVRADPDVIMVGEVRDQDTALIAIESALTGHLVLTTLHTNDAPLAAARLVEMGIEPYLVASGVACVVAQRLVRRLCDCKASVELSKELLADQGFEVDEGFAGFEPVGCVRCNHTGYRGRLGIYEVMPITDGLRKLILEKASADDMRDRARSEGMRTLREDGLEKIRDGVTSVAEVLRVAGCAAG